MLSKLPCNKCSAVRMIFIALCDDYRTNRNCKKIRAPRSRRRIFHAVLSRSQIVCSRRGDEGGCKGRKEGLTSVATYNNIPKHVNTLERARSAAVGRSFGTGDGRSAVAVKAGFTNDQRSRSALAATSCRQTALTSFFGEKLFFSAFSAELGDQSDHDFNIFVTRERLFISKGR